MKLFDVEDKRKMNFMVFFLYIVVVLVPFSVITHRYYMREIPSAESLYPVTTAILFVLHALIAFFMLMQYMANRKKLYMAVLSFAYSLSALYLVCKLLYYPGVFMAGSVIEGNLNDLSIYWIFRSITMAAVFVLTAYLYRRRDSIQLNHRLVLSMMLVVSLLLFVLTYMLSSENSLIGLDIVSADERNYSKLWSGKIGYIVALSWALATVLIAYVTRLKNTFWLAIGLSCISYFGNVVILHSSIYINSFAWRSARFFEVLSTFFIVTVLLYDIFVVYKKTLKKYRVSYESSIRDPLTNLYNRRYYYDAMKGYFDNKNTGGVNLAVLVADIDYFKHFNDTYGHIKGDEVIKYVAYTLARSLRDEDIPSRIGGEEFSAFVIGATQEEVCAIAERFRINVSQHETSDFSGTIPEQVTISVGVYFMVDADETAEGCVAKADAAMYQAKQSGRNCVVVYREPSA
ncbi:sensor domain-containing diguanylate cyclase [Rahnella woolbedingensis]|nr:GGDEF domain-containing protein [Rahnella woolbedingensis]